MSHPFPTCPILSTLPQSTPPHLPLLCQLTFFTMPSKTCRHQSTTGSPDWKNKQTLLHLVLLSVYQPRLTLQTTHTTNHMTTQPSYASAASQPATNNSNPHPKMRTHTPIKKDPIRFIVRYQGNAPRKEDRMLPIAISDNINQKLHSIPTANGLQVIGSHWNTTGNCILSFPTHTVPSLIKDHIPSIHSAMGLGEDHLITQDLPWSKLILASVLTRRTPNGDIFSDKLLLEMLSLNPIIKKLTITQQPRWIWPPTAISGLKSSISFAFEDPDGTILKHLLKTRIFMFGAPVKPQKWHDKPRLRQCEKCWKLGHTSSGCLKSTHCRICGNKHDKL